MAASTFELLGESEIALLDDDQLRRYVEAFTEYKNERAKAWILTEKQLFADKVADDVDELLYGGAAGGGKTEWALHRAYRLLQQFPNTRALYLRTTFPELRRTAIARALAKFDSDIATYYVGSKEWRFKNGSVLEFGFLDSDEDVYQYDSAEYMMLIFDELTQFTRMQYDFLQGRLRITAQQRRQGARAHSIAMSNPGGVGHTWVRDWFVTPTNYGQDVAELETIEGDPDSVVRVGFIPAFVHDNPHVDEDYIRKLKRLPEKLMRQRLFGDWDTFEGQYFDEFNRDVHVIKPFEIPEWWPRFCGNDFGFAAPAACVWVAVDPDGCLIVYKEYKAARRTPADQVADILVVDGDDTIDYRMADPSMMRVDSSGESIAQQYMRHGMPLRRGDNRRIDGWAHLRDLLRLDPETDTVGIKFFDTCFEMVRDLAALVHDRTKPEDVNTRSDDHLPDALRYAIMSRPRRNMPQNPREEFPSNVDEQARMYLKRLMSQQNSQSAYHDVLGRI